MQTIIVKLDAGKLANPDLDIRYRLPEKIEAFTAGKVKENGYDYLGEKELGIWLAAENASAQVQDVIACLKKKRFAGNDLSMAAQIYISDQESAPLSECQEVELIPDSEKGLPEYVNVSVSEDLVDVCFYVEMEKPFAIGEKMNEICGDAYMNGCNWEAFLECYLETNFPQLLEGLDSDPEAGMYAAYYEDTPENRTKGEQFAGLIAYLVEDEEDLYGFVREMGEEIEWD